MICKNPITMLILITLLHRHMKFQTNACRYSYTMSCTISSFSAGSCISCVETFFANVAKSNIVGTTIYVQFTSISEKNSSSSRSERLSALRAISLARVEITPTPSFFPVCCFLENCCSSSSSARDYRQDKAIADDHLILHDTILLLTLVKVSNSSTSFSFALSCVSSCNNACACSS